MSKFTTSSKGTKTNQPTERNIPIKIETTIPLKVTPSQDRLLQDLQKPAAVAEQKLREEEEEKREGDSDSPVSVETTSNLENELETEIPERTVIPCNQPEKIVLVVDTALDENCTEFKTQDGESCTPLMMLARGIEMFLRNKCAIDPRHQYALIILNENEAKWMLDFTSDANRVLKVLHSLEECNTEDIFSLNSLFDAINEHVMLEPAKEDLMIPPGYIVRAILFYARSYTLPEITRSEEVESLLSSPYFTFDILMTHEPPDTANKCANISKVLQNIDTKGFAYFFSVARNTADLYVAMAKLLSHPLQRPVQRVAKYTIL